MKMCKSIRALRGALKVSQKQLAELINVKQATVSAWEVKLCYPSLRNYNKLERLAEKHNLKIVMKYILNLKN